MSTQQPRHTQMSGSSPSSAKDSKDNLYVWVDGKKYDLTAFSSIHPGGQYVLNEFQNKDATLFYHSTHKNRIIHKIFKPTEQVTSTLSTNADINAFEFETTGHTVNGKDTNVVYTFSKEYKQLVKDAYTLLNNDPYAPVLWYIRAMFIIIPIFMCLYLETFYFDSIKVIILVRCLHGLLVSYVGLNVLHDASHGSVSRYHWINRVLQYLGNDILSGQSSQHWRVHHGYLHHPYTNNSTIDPDINFRNTIITEHHYTNFNKKLFWYHKWQHYYVFCLFQLFPILRHFFDIYTMGVLNKIYTYKIPKRAQFETKINAVLKVIFLVSYYVIPFYIYTQINEFGYVVSVVLLHIASAIGASYLGFFFLISHFFEGTEAYNNNNKNMKNKNKKDIDIMQLDWAKSQMESSANVAGNVLAFLNGSLNYQIEHHLFPRVNSMHYPKLLTLTKRFATHNKFKYVHFPTITQNAISTIKWFRLKQWMMKFIQNK